MEPEIEAKFTNLAHDEIRAKLKKLGAICEHEMMLYKRVTVDSSDMRAKTGWLRVRDEGTKVTFTYKQIDKLSIDGVKEIEVEVSDFDATVAILKASVAGCWTSFQESRREKWRLGDAEVVLDEWPWLKPYIEIEAKSEQTVRDAARELGLDWNEAYFGDVMTLYQLEYPHLQQGETIADIDEVHFGDPLPPMLQPR